MTQNEDADGKKDSKKAIDIKSNVVARTITFDDYTRCLNKEIEMMRRQSCIRVSKLHDIRIALRNNIWQQMIPDVLPDSTETLPWGIGGYTFVIYMH